MESAGAEQSLWMLWFCVLAAAWFFIGMLVLRRVARKWGERRTVRATMVGLCGLPVAAMLVAVSLFVRIRLSGGAWPKWVSSMEFLDGEWVYDPRPMAHGAELHLVLAQAFCILALMSVVVFAPALIAFFRERRLSRSAAAVYVASFAILACWRWADPGGLMYWLLT
jgi:hypothetical protein